MRAALAALFWIVPGTADAACRLALALALDVSGSVDAREYDLQMGGVAGALGDPEVVEAILAIPDVPVALSIFEWSSTSYQRIVQDWVLIEDRPALDRVRKRLAGWRREPAPEATGLGAALAYAADLMREAPGCWDQTLDISADGKNNDWPLPERLREAGALGTMNVNALVVASDFLVAYDTSRAGVAEMAAYFEHRIIYGPDAFVEIALGYDDYRDAMKRKLLRELTTRPIGSAPRTSPYRQADLR